MNIKKIFNYSPNFDSSKRKTKQIKFIIFHYTGMKNEREALHKLTDVRSKVSSHYFIKNNGEVVVLVPDLYTAWHAGISYWKNFKSLNKNSIGIEINNPGHEFKYKKFSKKQIQSIIKLSKFLINKYKIKPQNILGHSDIAPFRKKDPGEKFPWKYLSLNKIGYWHKLNQKKLEKNRYLKINDFEKKIFFQNLKLIGYTVATTKRSKANTLKSFDVITKAFQRRFRQDKINGIIDQECLMISENLAKILN